MYSSPFVFIITLLLSSVKWCLCVWIIENVSSKVCYFINRHLLLRKVGKVLQKDVPS